jgi:S2P endopeptidase
MSLASFASALSIFWLILYCIHWISQQNNTTPETILPSHQQNLRNNGSILGHYNLRITIRFLQARIETTSLNKFHDKLLNRLKRKSHSGLRAWLERFYTLGYVSGIFGMVVALGLLMWTTWTLMKPISFHKIVKVSRSVGKLMKRDGQITTYQDLAPESPITPIVRSNLLVA